MEEAECKELPMLSCEHCLCPANKGQCPCAWLHTNQNGIVDSFLKNAVFHNSGTIDPLAKPLFNVGNNPVNPRMLVLDFCSQKSQF